MNIVVTDAFTLNPGDLNWSGIKNHGSLTIFDRTTSDKLLIERCENAEVIITNKNTFNKEILSELPNLKLIAVAATGYNIIDTKYARERGIAVCNVPDYGTDSVAQHTFALILEISNQVGLHNESVHNDEWINAIDWCYIKKPISELSGKTLGIIGYGKIGQKTAEIGKAFGMKIKYHNSKPIIGNENDYLPLIDLLNVSDFISLHCPAKPESIGMVNLGFLKLMKNNAYLINTSRGQLINENDLAFALNENIIAGAALDVLLTEPPAKNNPLLKAKNCIITPHNAWQAKEARERIMLQLEKNISSFLHGNPINIVN